MKEFNSIERASIKRTAQNVERFVVKKTKTLEKIAELQEELESIQRMIDSWQAPIKEMTGGYTTEDLIRTVTIVTGTDPKTGKEITAKKYEFIYPDTVIPPVVEGSEEVSEEASEETTEEGSEGNEEFSEFI